MIREQVVITAIRVKKAGQVIHFQVKLPKDTTRIIGVEITAKLFSYPQDSASGSADGTAGGIDPRAPKELKPLLFKRDLCLGEVKLQSCEEANIFYAADLIVDKNIGLQDFSQNAFWKPSNITHQTKAFEETIIVDGDSTVIQGFYRDRSVTSISTPIDYQVNIYVWTERSEF